MTLGLRKGSVGFPLAEECGDYKVCKELLFLQIMYNLFSAIEPAHSQDTITELTEILINSQATESLF